MKNSEIPTTSTAVDHRCVQLSMRPLKQTQSSHSERRSRMSMSLSSNGVLSFHDLTYTIGKSNYKCPSIFQRIPCLQSKPSQQIIDHVSGVFTPGLNAIMGPSGGGKSTLLDILADRKDHHGLSGHVLVDGASLPHSYKYIVGYVVQDDIISSTLTVRENLMFSANVRLSDDVDDHERKDRVRQVISDLGLESCADTKVGNELIRGISGGERKRACIGMELVLSPKILFLDEPTTGLDASTARSVMQCLKKLGQNGRTIIFSIHQPRYSIFKLFDRILLMCKGKNVYHGPASGMIPFFSAQGHHCELHDNPADFALDILIDVTRDSSSSQQLEDAYKKSEVCSEVDRFLSAQSIDADLEHIRRHQQGAAARSFLVETFYVAMRTLKNALRNPALFLSQVVVAIIVGLLVGVVFFDMKRTTDPGVQNRLGAIFFIIVSQVFSTVTALESLIQERSLFIHEYISGYYRIPTFFVAKLICDILPMRAIPSVIFSVIGYFMTGLQRTAGQFFIFVLAVFMSSVFGSALCFFISAAIPTFSVALIVVVLIFVIMMVFSGFLVDLSSVFDWLSWIQWISAFRYSSNVLVINEFRNNTFCLSNATAICPMTGMDVLKTQNLTYDNDWDLWKHFFALSLMAFTFLLLAFIQLFQIKKNK